MDIEKFKREHVDLLAAVAALREPVQTGVQEHAEAILNRLVTMSSAIKLHLAAEGRVLYPALINAVDPRVAHVGKQFQEKNGRSGTRLFRFRVALEPDGKNQQGSGRVPQ